MPTSQGVFLPPHMSSPLETKQDSIIVSIHRMGSLGEPLSGYLCCLVYSIVLWISLILLFKYSLKGLLTYTSWMHEPRGKMSLMTKVWLVRG